MITSTRRSFLKTAGSLTIGFWMGAPGSLFAAGNADEIPESLKRNPRINSWLEVLPDGRIRIYTGKLELGQGIRIAIAQVAAEELEHDIHKVEVVLADTGRTPDEGYTAGSGSMEQSAMAVRYASAAAKAKLLQLAAARLQLPVDQLSLSNGVAQTKTGNLKISFSDLIDGRQISDEVKEPVLLKNKSTYRYVGEPVHRTDIAEMVTAKPVYVQDLRFPGMVHARIVRPPSYTARLLQIDEEYFRKNSPLILKIARNGNFVGVIADDEYQAVKAQQALKLSCKWSETSLPVDGDHNIETQLEKLEAKTERVHEKGKIDADGFQYEAKYYKPYLMHGAIGPSCAVAIYNNEELSIWTHSQGVFPLREAVSKMLRMNEEKIRVTGVPGAGCYGHNGADDVAAEAALLAIAYPGKHIRLQWSREDEHMWEPYGSAMIMKAAANLDDNGNIVDWKYDLWSDNHSTRPGGNASNLLPARYIENPFDPPSGRYGGGAYRNSQPYYTIPNQLVHAHIVKTPLRVSALRSLGAYANIFAIECFMDELAEKAKRDPFEFRMAHQQDQRAKEVLQLLQTMMKNEKTERGEGIGIAFSRYKNSASYCAAGAKVQIDNVARKIRVLKMWASIDAGEAINPDGIINQTEGGLIQSASWTLMEEVKFDKRHVVSGDWSTYPIMRFADAPEVHVELIARPEEEVLGAGEAAQGPAVAAIVNAIYRACGKRVRSLPAQKEIFPEL